MIDTEKSWDIISEKFKENWSRIEAEDKAAKRAAKLVGRYISHSYADGAAYYSITVERKNCVVIEVITGIGDDWVLPAWGKKSTISKKLAEGFIRQRDGLNEILEKTIEGD